MGIERLSRDIPTPPSTRAFIQRPLYRPPGSFRCYYMSPSWLDAEHPEGAVLAIKGMEPAASDFDSALRDLRKPCYSPHNIAEHLIFEERKIPGCMSVDEARREAERAASLQVSHLGAYGQLARAPIPLLVLRHSVEREQAVVQSLKQQLSAPAFETVQRLLARGIGVYVYGYASPPVRVRDLQTMLAGLDFRQRMFSLISACDPDAVIRRWVSLFVRMLYLGMLPGSLASLRTGICCQPQNACMDGGFVDLESLTRVSELADDGAVYAALQLSTDALIDTVRSLLAEGADATGPQDGRGQYERRLVEAHVLSRIEEAITANRRHSLNLDPRISGYFGRQQSFDGLVQRLSTCYPPASPAFSEGVRAFGEFGFALLRKACRA